MISWQIQIDGHDPEGWDQRRDGCWFPDFDHQEYLLPYFDVGDTPIDPYGGTGFSAADMQRLRVHLRCLSGYIEAMPERWTLTESAAGESRTLNLERAAIEIVIDKILEKLDFALERKGTLWFGGD